MGHTKFLSFKKACYNEKRASVSFTIIDKPKVRINYTSTR
jgi:hypothetical protein